MNFFTHPTILEEKYEKKKKFRSASFIYRHNLYGKWWHLWMNCWSCYFKKPLQHTQDDISVIWRHLESRKIDSLLRKTDDVDQIMCTEISEKNETITLSAKSYLHGRRIDKQCASIEIGKCMKKRPVHHFSFCFE